MAKIRILSVGKIKQRFILDGEQEYLTRLKNELKIECVELGSEHSTALSELETKQREAQQVLKQLKESDYLVVLDEGGEQVTSTQFAGFMQERMNSGVSQLTFLIGGAYGWDASIKKRANKLLSLSKLTFTYQMTRLILIEQLYRATMILKGAPYHKG